MKSDSLEVLKTSFDLPILTREQEIALFRQCEKGGPDAEAAREKLFLHNLRLVRHIAKKIFLNIDLEDKIQWGVVGLSRAIDKFDWRKGHKFATYAPYWIKQAISREASHYSTVCGFNLPAHMFDDYSKASRIIAQEGLEPSVELIINHPEMMRMEKGKKVRMSLAKAKKILELIKNDGQSVPLDKEIVSSKSGNNSRLGEFLPDPKAESAFDFMINLEIVKSLLSCLTENQRQMVSLYFLVDGATQESVAMQTGVKPQRVSQLLADGLERMRLKAEQLGIHYP
jgi:RNA polymerase primary sigma factor